MTPIESLKESLNLLQKVENIPKEEEPLQRTVLAALEEIESIFERHASEITDSGLVQRTLEVLDLYEHTPQFEEPKSSDETFFCGMIIHVQQIAYLRKMQLATSSYEVKTGRKLPERTLQDFLSSELKERKLQIPASEVEAVVASRFHELHKERSRLLRNIPAAYQVLFPEGKCKYPKETVASKSFPLTKAWYMGAFAEGEDDLLEAVIEIAEENQIRLFSDTSQIEPTDADTLVIMDYGQTPENEATFSQDICDFSQTTVHIPAMADELEFTLRAHHFYQGMTDALIRNRFNRHLQWAKAPDKVLRMVLGNTIVRSLSKKAIFLAEAAQIPIVMCLSYNEGGNTIPGEDKDGPYAIIGYDSFVATKYILEKNLKRAVPNEEVTMAFAIDYGIPKERLYFIEQPGDFHLDMKMAIVGERTVVLNSSKTSLRLFDEHRKKNSAEDEDFLIQTSTCKHEFENIVERQLRSLGFNVIRIPGCYDVIYRHHIMNFFNFVTATTPDKKKIVIAMGCLDKSYENRFRLMLKQTEAKDAKVYFLPLQPSIDCLSLEAGVACRMKTMPGSE